MILENLKTLKVFEQYLKSDSILRNELDAKKRKIDGLDIN